MTGYTKLFGRILDSTIWQEDNPTRILWITMLAMADRDGLVMASVPGLASRAKISLSECEAGLAKFQEPDQYSQSPVDEGRRIQVVTGGWLLINYEAYRQKMSAEEQREKARLRQQRLRMSRKSVTERDSHAMSHDVAPCNDIAEAKAEADTKEEKSKSVSHFVRPTIQEVSDYCQKRNNGIDPEKFFAYYESQGWYVGKKRMSNWKYAVITWEKNNYGGGFRDSYQKTEGRGGIQPNKAELRTSRNREAIIAGLGFGTESRRSIPGEQDRPAAGGDSGLEKNLLRGETRGD